MGVADAANSGGRGSAFFADEVLERVVVAGLGTRRAGCTVVAEVGVAESGVPVRGVPAERLRGGGVHSSFSNRWMGLRRERIDWTGTGGPRGVP